MNALKANKSTPCKLYKFTCDLTGNKNANNWGKITLQNLKNRFLAHNFNVRPPQLHLGSPSVFVGDCQSVASSKPFRPPTASISMTVLTLSVWEIEDLT